MISCLVLQYNLPFPILLVFEWLEGCFRFHIVVYFILKPSDINMTDPEMARYKIVKNRGLSGNYKSDS